MNAFILYRNACLSGLLVFGLGSCTAPSTSLRESTAPTTPTPTRSTPDQSVTPSPPSPSALPTLPADRLVAATTTVNIYKIDSQCVNLLPQKTTVTKTRSMEAAIAKVLEETDSGDFSIAGYRVSREGERAIVDLRLPANSKRSFHSLSSCEQLALFGGIRKTLLNNAQWQIQSVQFTEKGEEIVL